MICMFVLITIVSSHFAFLFGFVSSLSRTKSDLILLPVIRGFNSYAVDLWIVPEVEEENESWRNKQNSVK